MHQNVRGTSASATKSWKANSFNIQNYRQQNNQGAPVPNNQNKPSQPRGNNKPNTLKFDSEFDFEQANSQFEELRSELAKLKVGSEETKTPDQVN